MQRLQNIIKLLQGLQKKAFSEGVSQEVRLLVCSKKAISLEKIIKVCSGLR
jgi:hypothetical protein